MQSGIQHTLTLLFLIAIGFTMKKAGLLSALERRTMSKIYLIITLPATIIASFSSYAGEVELLVLAPVGAAISCVMMAVTLHLVKKHSKEDRAFAVFNCSGVNIGSFALPFLQGYLNVSELVLVMLYDIGNGIVALGGTNVAGELILDKGKPGVVKLAIKKLLQSICVWTYLLMLVLCLFNLRLPEFIYEAAAYIGAANPIMSMLMVGAMLNFNCPPSRRKWIGKLLLIHYGTVAVLALLVYLVLPLPQVIRAVIVMMLVSPLSSAGLMFTDSYNLDCDSAGLLNSISIVVGIVMVLLLLPIVMPQ